MLKVRRIALISKDKNINALISKKLKTLRGEVKKLSGAGDSATDDLNAMNSLLHILEKGLFEFEDEPWFPVYEPGDKPAANLVGEQLFRVKGTKDNPGRKITALRALILFAKHGLGPHIDTVLVVAALEQAAAKNVFPVSLNITSEAAASPQFWDELAPVLAEHQMEDIIFEILEHDCPAVADDLSHLKELRGKGLRFALDDMTDDENSLTRLERFGSHMDFIKIDGKVVRRALDDGNDLQELIVHVERHAPDAVLIGEWIETMEEARHVRDEFNIRTVQGRDLEKHVGTGGKDADGDAKKKAEGNPKP